MSDLTLNNIKQISLDIRRQHIIVPGLADDLIDHICCDVEEEMDQGLPFPDAYKKVKQKVGQGRIREIQEETLYAIDSKYRKMKNLMKISGVAGTTIIVLGAIFKIQHFPGAGALLTTGALVLALLFLPSSLGVLWKESHSSKNLFLFISAFLAGVLFIFGTLFKIQHWPGAGMVLLFSDICFILLFIPALIAGKFSDPDRKEKRPLYLLVSAGAILCAAGLLFKIQHWPFAAAFMITGILMICLVALPWYTFYTWKQEPEVNARFIFIITAVMLILVPATLISLNLQNRFDSGFYSALEKQQQLSGFQLKQNQQLLELYRDSACYTTLERLNEKTSALLRNVVQTGSGMLAPVLNQDSGGDIAQLSEGKTIFPAIGPADLKQPFGTDQVNRFLLPGTSSRTDLEKAVAAYLGEISAFTTGERAGKYGSVLDPAIYLPSAVPEKGPCSLLSGLHGLELLVNSILAVEGDLQKTITGNNF